jgi:hypothetical protein
LHVAALRLAQADPIFSSPVCHVGEGRRVDGRRRLAGWRSYPPRRNARRRRFPGPTM